MTEVTITATAPTLAEALAAINSVAPTPNPTPVPGPTPTPMPVPIPPDVNVYPLTMPSGLANGADVNIGTGPDLIHIKATNTNPGNVTPDKYCSIAILIDGKVVAAPLDVTALADSPIPNQNFNIRGSWGPLPHLIGITSGGQRVGLSNLMVREVSYNYTPLGLATPTVVQHGTTDPAGETSVWDNLGVPLVFSSISAPTTPTPPPTSSVGADPISNGQTLDQLVAATASGGTLTLPAGTFHGAAVSRVPMTIVGAGAGKTMLTGLGFTVPNGKALLDAAANLTVTDLTFQDASVPDMNGAGIRTEPDRNLTVTRCEFTRCQNGILTAPDAALGPPGDIVIADSKFYNNGAGDGHTHEIYIGQADSVSVTNSTFTCGTKSTHAFKSRAKASTLKGCALKGTLPVADMSLSQAGSVADFPEGGDVLLEDCSLELVPGIDNILFLGYLMENQLAGVKTVTLRRVHLIDGTGTGGYVTAKGGNLIIDTCTYSGAKPPQVTGWASVSGTFVAA